MSTPTLRQLLQQRTTLSDKMRDIHKNHQGELPEAEQRKWEDLKTKAEELTPDIDRLSFLDDLDRRAIGTPLDGTGDASFDKLQSQVSVLDVVRAQMPGVTDAGTGRARELSQEISRRSGRAPEGLFYSMARMRPVEQRVFTTTLPAGGPGSNLVQTTISQSMIDILRARLIVRGLGATVIGGLVGNLSIPRLKASATGTWVAENSPLTISDPQVDAVALTPKHVGGIVEISRNMVLQTSPDAEQMVENDLAQVIATAIDQAALVGGTTAAEPRGLLHASSGITIVPIAAVGGAPTWDMAITLIAAVEMNNASGGAFATNPKAVAKMRRTLRHTADTSSSFLMEGPNTLAGYPLAVSMLVPSNGTKSTGTNLSALIFGDWSQLVLGFWSELDILVNPFETVAYSKGNVQIRAMATADVAIKQPLAFAAVTDMITT